MDIFELGSQLYRESIVLTRIGGTKVTQNFRKFFRRSKTTVNIKHHKNNFLEEKGEKNFLSCLGPPIVLRFVAKKCFCRKKNFPNICR
jgi:hypothetical protein